MSTNFNQDLSAAIAAHQKGDWVLAEQTYRQLLKKHPQHPDLLHLLGVLAYQQNHLDEARDLIRQAIALHSTEAQYHSNLGNVWQAMQRYAEAVPCYEKALALDANNPVILCNIGNALLMLAREPEASVYFDRALALAPDDLAVLLGYGLLLKASRRPADAAAYFVRVLERDPESVPCHINLGNVLRDAGLYAEAMQQYAWVLQRQPNHLEAHYNMALTRRLSGDVAGALAQMQHCLNLDECYVDAHHAMVTILESEADHAATIQAFHATLAAHPQAAQLHSVLAYSSDFDSSLSAADQQQVRKDWYAQQIVPRGIAPLPLLVDRAPRKKLRIGFIPGRFYRNASVYAYLPVLLQLDPAQFEVWCYDAFHNSDEFTDLIRARADGWCDITRMSDAEVALRIRDDKIDILVDLFAHAGANRLPIYAYKPAPIQVTAWGHANGTGMACMDYLFSDPVSIPPAEVGLYAEHVHYLPCQLSYWLPENAPSVASLPMETNGFITFGCFNRMIKVSDTVLVLWAQLMARIPDSRLVLKAAELAEAPQRERVIQIFQQHGIALERLRFYTASPWFEHLQCYEEVDFALDPFPMGGGVTTLDALWMGVPVLCLRGETLGRRITSAIMAAVGLVDWVSESPEGYLQLALNKAQHVSELRQLRATLRRRMAASPLANPDFYVGCVEDAFIAFWQQWCRDENQRLPQPAVASFAVAEHAAAAQQLWHDFLANPDDDSVNQRLVTSMQRAGKLGLAAEFASANKQV